jgi:hypothetical protein
VEEKRKLLPWHRHGFIQIPLSRSETSRKCRLNQGKLLDTLRNLASVERNAVQLRGDRAAATVSLIRALGGWDAQQAFGLANAGLAAQ